PFILKETKMVNLSTQALKHPASIAGAVATGFVVGLAANLGRKAIVQGVSAVQGEWDEELKAEHRATLKLFDAIESTTEKHGVRRKMLLVQLKHALSKHAFEEENVIYPAMRDHGQVKEADALVHDHGYVKQYLFDLSELSSDDPAWIAKVREFRADIEKHIRSEEEELFPRLRAALGEEGNKHVTHVM